MKQLHIAMLAPFGIRPKGTLSARMLPLAQALVRQHHTVHIIAPPVHNPQDAGRRDVYANVIVHHTPCPTLPGLAGVIQQVLLLIRWSLTPRPNLIHLFKPKGYSGLAALLMRLMPPDLPLVVDTDDWEGWGGWNDLLPYPYSAKMVFAWQERDLPRRADAVTVASRTLEAQVRDFGVPPDRIFYVPNGIVPETLHIRTAQALQARTILLYTRFWEFQVEELVAALVAIVQQRPDARLLVVGRGERQEEQMLLRLAHRAGVETAIDYRGWVEPADLPALFAIADIALVPQDDTLINRARCSAKLLEMIAAGIPIVAANVGQVQEYISDGQSGLLVPPGNPAALARAALALLADAPLRQRLSLKAQQSLKAFSWDSLAHTVEHVYCQVTHPSGRYSTYPSHGASIHLAETSQAER